MNTPRINDGLIDGNEQRICADCGLTWTYTASEAAWISEKGFKAPRRCKTCRAQNRAQVPRERY